MNTNNLNTVLYEKMATEQEKYRDWLKSQPPEEILHHTYEYTVREDIVMAMEELELTDAQAQALLESPSPLADVYRYFEKLETGYMDMIRDSIENRADDVCRAKEEVGKPFPFEDDLRVKSARLVELDTLLNIDGKGHTQPETVVAKSARPSVLDSLKRPVPPRSLEKKPKQHEEVR